MFGQVVTRPLRSCGLSASFRILSLSSHTRKLAKHNKPRRPISADNPSISSPTHQHEVGTPKWPVPVVPPISSSTKNPPIASLKESATSSPLNTNTAIHDKSPPNPDFKEDSKISSARAPHQDSEPLPPLPDLTQGIPSTLNSEIERASRRSEPATQSLNITESSSGSSTGSQGGGELPNSAYISSLDRRRTRLANFMYATLLGLSVTGAIFLGRNWDTEEQEKKHPDTPSGWGLGLFYRRANARLRDMLDYYNEPAFPRLLPSLKNMDPLMERPYTLVLDLEDLLVHSEWTREHGWRMAKRPGVDYFLRYLSQYYELVIFTTLPSMNADPIIRKLDPYRIVMWPLFREATRFKNGEYIKDLSYLNRDLSKIIMIDTEKARAKLQPENAIILSKWKGSLQDKELVSLIPFLEYIGTMGFDDVREVLRSFEGTHIPTEYAKREAAARERLQQKLAGDRATRSRRPGIGSLGNALGLRAGGVGLDGMEQSLAEGLQQGKTYQDQMRERGQKQYEMLEQQIRENGDKWLKEMAQEEEKFMKEEQLKGMTGFLGIFNFGRKGD